MSQEITSLLRELLLHKNREIKSPTAAEPSSSLGMYSFLNPINKKSQHLTHFIFTREGAIILENMRKNLQHSEALNSFISHLFSMYPA